MEFLTAFGLSANVDTSIVHILVFWTATSVGTINVGFVFSISIKKSIGKYIYGAIIKNLNSDRGYYLKYE